MRQNRAQHSAAQPGVNPSPVLSHPSRRIATRRLHAGRVGSSSSDCAPAGRNSSNHAYICRTRPPYQRVRLSGLPTTPHHLPSSAQHDAVRYSGRSPDHRIGAGGPGVLATTYPAGVRGSLGRRIYDCAMATRRTSSLGSSTRSIRPSTQSIGPIGRLQRWACGMVAGLTGSVTGRLQLEAWSRPLQMEIAAAQGRRLPQEPRRACFVWGSTRPNGRSCIH